MQPIEIFSGASLAISAAAFCVQPSPLWSGGGGYNGNGNVLVELGGRRSRCEQRSRFQHPAPADETGEKKRPASTRTGTSPTPPANSPTEKEASVTDIQVFLETSDSRTAPSIYRLSAGVKGSGIQDDHKTMKPT